MEDSIDDLLFKQVQRILEKKEPSAGELELARKYLNDRAARGGKIHTAGFSADPQDQKSDWEGIQFDVPITNGPGKSSPHSSSSVGSRGSSTGSRFGNQGEAEEE